MAIQKATIVWDDQNHPDVHRAMTNHQGQSDAAYLRHCVEFFQANNGGANLQLILDRLTAIERLINSGPIRLAGGVAGELEDNFSDEIFDAALEQLQ